MKIQSSRAKSFGIFKGTNFRKLSIDAKYKFTKFFQLILDRKSAESILWILSCTRHQPTILRLSAAPFRFCFGYRYFRHRNKEWHRAVRASTAKSPFRVYQLFLGQGHWPSIEMVRHSARKPFCSVFCDPKWLAAVADG